MHERNNPSSPPTKNPDGEGTNPRAGTNRKSRRGFASMDKKRQREIAASGGRATSSQFKAGDERTVDAGRKGGTVSSGNFSHDRERAVEAGRKGGQATGRKK